MANYIYRSILFAFLLKLASANLTTCEKSQQHFADMCFSPSPALNIDFNWFRVNQPAEGWYHVIGNDVTQFHASELVQKKALNRTDDFSEFCMKIKVDYGNGHGNISGYGGQVSSYVCSNSMDFPGTQRCDIQLDHSKFHEDLVFYISHHDQATKLGVAIYCYPNGQVGWATISRNPNLTEEERTTAINYAEKLGFPKDTHEILYGDKCPQ